MREACRLAKSKPPEVWYDFLTQFRDGRYDPFREEALDICAALATASGKSLEVWDLIERAKLTQTERISLCRGLIVGTLARRPAASAAPSVDESKSAASL